jgi:hypothetical protein
MESKSLTVYDLVTVRYDTYSKTRNFGWNKIYFQIETTIRSYIWGQISSHISNQIGNSIRNQINDHVMSQTYEYIKS